MLTFLRSLPLECTPARPQVIGSSAIDSLPETYHFFRSVFPEESQNPAGNESHERLALTIQQRQFTALDGGRRGRFDSGKGDFGTGGFGGSTEDFGQGGGCFGGGKGDFDRGGRFAGRGGF